MTSLYAIRAGRTDAVKIGIAEVVDDRRASLQIGSFEELLVEREIPGSGEYEQIVHEIMSPLGLRGEWFAIEPGLIDKLFQAIENDLFIAEIELFSRASKQVRSAIFGKAHPEELIEAAMQGRLGSIIERAKFEKYGPFISLPLMPQTRERGRPVEPHSLRQSGVLFQMRMPRDLAQRGKAKAKLHGVPLSEIVRAHIERWIADETNCGTAPATSLDSAD